MKPHFWGILFYENRRKKKSQAKRKPGQVAKDKKRFPIPRATFAANSKNRHDGNKLRKHCHVVEERHVGRSTCRQILHSDPSAACPDSGPAQCSIAPYCQARHHSCRKPQSHFARRTRTPVGQVRCLKPLALSAFIHRLAVRVHVLYAELHGTPVRYCIRQLRSQTCNHVLNGIEADVAHFR